MAFFEKTPCHAFGKEADRPEPSARLRYRGLALIAARRYHAAEMEGIAGGMTVLFLARAVRLRAHF